MADVKKIIELEIDVNTGEVKNLNKEVANVAQKTKETNKETSALTSQLDKMTGGAISGFRNMMSGIRGMITGMKSLKLAVISTGIGALLVAITSVVAYFEKTERGAQKLRVIMAVLGAVMDTVIDVAIKLGEALVEAVLNPQKAIEEFTELIKYYFLEFIPNAIDKVINGFGLLGEAITKALKGDLTGALESAKKGTEQLADGFIDLQPGLAITRALVKGAIELGEEMIADAEAAAILEERMNALKLAERELRVERASTNKEIAKARLLAEDESIAAEKRLEALKNANILEAAQAKKELAQERERLDIMQQQADLSESNEDVLDKISEQRAKIFDLETASLRLQKRLATEIISFEREIAAAIDARLKKQQEDNVKLIDTEKQRQDAITKINKDALQLRESDRQAYYYDGDKYLEDQEKKEKQLQDAKYKVANDTINALLALNKAFAGESEEAQKKAFQIEKALKLSQTIMASIQGVQNAFTTAMASPITAAFPAYPFIQAGIAGAFGAAQIAAISKSKYNSGESSRPSSIGQAPSMTGGAPQFNTVGASGINQLSQSIAGQNQKPVQAYVVANDISSAQSMERNRVQQASFP